MTDKEKAEEYIKGIEYCDKVYNDISGGYTILYDEDQLEQAYLDGLAEGRKEIRDRVADVPYTILKECASERLKKENAELHAEIAELKEKHESNKRALKLIIEKGVNLEKENEELKAQIEKMKADIRENIKWADQNKNNQMWQKLVKMMNEWS